MRYAVINDADTLVYSVHDYNGVDWETFKEGWDASNPGYLLVDLGSSVFPAGQGWTQDTDGIYPPTESVGIAGVMPAILTAIEFKTTQLEETGSVSFKGHPFPRTHTVRDGVVLLYTCCASDVDFIDQLLPLEVVAQDGAIVSVDNLTDSKNFAMAMLASLKDGYSAQATQIDAVQGMTTITQLIQYTDPR